MGIKLNKDQTITVSWATVAAVATSFATVWGFGSSIVQNAMAAEVKQEITKQLEPIQRQISAQTAASIVSLGANVKNLRTQITAMRFKKDMCGLAPGCWTLRDAGDLEAAENDLKAAENALRLLTN